MFSGPYLIMDVNHTITPNDMSTTFNGVRVGIPSLPKITDLISSIQETLLKSMDDDLEETPVPNHSGYKETLLMSQRVRLLVRDHTKE